MSRVEAEPTATAEWHTLVRAAGDICGAQLDEPVEAYLVFMLMRFSERADLGRHALALDYLAGMQGSECLRDTGDECLIVCGLFPQRARRKRVPLGYFVDLGRGAYGTLADQGEASEAAPFDALAARFLTLMEVLQAMRPVDHPQAPSTLDAAEIAEQTGSRAAWNRLRPAATLLAAGPKRRRH